MNASYLQANNSLFSEPFKLNIIFVLLDISFKHFLKNKTKQKQKLYSST